jgi:hypothetical protein
VFLHIGHSNMAGRVTTPADLRPFNFETHRGCGPTPRRRLAAGQGAAVRRQHERQLRRRGLRPDCPAAPGPGMSILRDRAGRGPRTAYVVSIGRGQSG